MPEYNRLIAADENFNVIPEIRKKIVDSVEFTEKIRQAKSEAISESKELPVSGTSGQLLSKTDSGVAWVDQKKELPVGGSEGQALVRIGTGVGWADVANEQWDEEAQAQAQGFWIVAGPTKPSYDTKYGVPVYWLDTNIIRDPSAWVATAPTFSLATQSYTIPSDEGVNYKVDGAIVQPGVHKVTTIPSTVDIYAEAKVGYTLTGVNSWSQKFTNTLSNYDAYVLGLDLEHYYRMADPTQWNKNNGKSSPLNFNATLTKGVDIGAGYGSCEATGNIVMTPFPQKQTSAFTMGIVVRPSTAGIMTKLNMKTWDSKTQFDFFSPYNTGTYNFTLTVGGKSVNLGTFEGVFESSKTHLVVLTLQNGIGSLYVDGVKSLTTTDCPDVVPSAGVALSSNRVDSSAKTLVSSIIMDSSKALTETQISEMYKSLVL